MKARCFCLLSVLIAWTFALAACSTPEAEIIEKEVTRVVTEKEVETVIVEGTPQVVEKEVTRIVKVVETPDEEAMPEKSSPIIAFSGEPDSLCFIEGNLQAFMMSKNIFDSLIEWDWDKGEFVPSLATKWEQESETTWLFHIREGVQFHKGYGELTAEDVAFSTNVIVENSLPSLWLLEGVDHAEVVDQYTVRYHMQYPHSPFLFFVARGIGVLSKAAYEEMGRDAFIRNPIGSGPFELNEWISGNHLVLVKNNDYWQEGVPMSDEITVRFVPEAATRYALLSAGQVDIVESPDYKDIEVLEADPNIVVNEIAGYAWDALVFNTTKAPVDNKLVRQAIGYGIDRESLIEGVYFGHGTPDDDPLPAGFPGAEPDQQLYPNTADQEKAKALLAEAGYPDGIDISLMISGNETMIQIAQIISEQLAEVGINVEINQVDSGTYVMTMWASKTEMDAHMTIAPVSLAAPDPDSTMYWFHHTDTDGWHGWDNPEVDPLLEKGRELADVDERIELYRQMVDLILEDAPYVYMMNKNFIWAWQSDVQGFSVSPEPSVIDLNKIFLDR
ncbi:MAG: ABC transporter substrate-binding protein [Anaerolineales bacterium]|nr:ABC transporter substrate-binding protein [Anaerolineales bacterium]